MATMFKIPSVPASSSDKPEWEALELASLPSILAKQVSAIHEGEQALKAMKAKFAQDFNASYSVDIPDGMVRIFGFNFAGVSIANVVPRTRKGGKAKVTFVARKSK